MIVILDSNPCLCCVVQQDGAATVVHEPPSASQPFVSGALWMQLFVRGGLVGGCMAIVRSERWADPHLDQRKGRGQDQPELFSQDDVQSCHTDESIRHQSIAVIVEIASAVDARGDALGARRRVDPERGHRLGDLEPDVGRGRIQGQNEISGQALQAKGIDHGAQDRRRDLVGHDLKLTTWHRFAR